MTIEVGTDHPELGNKLPFLDTAIWMDYKDENCPQGKLMHKHYKKAMASKVGVQVESAINERVKRTINTQEVIRALRNCHEDLPDEEKNEVSKLRSDLDEHRSVIETLRGKLNEVNLLNAKLLFTNKLFRKYGLNNEQKMKVVEQFDRASNLREVKLVYSTLGESFGSARKNEINESKGSASKPVASTKSEKKVISESTELRDRFKKLANLI